MFDEENVSSNFVPVISLFFEENANAYISFGYQDTTQEVGNIYQVD